MKARQNKCLWGDQCEECESGCEYYTPIDSAFDEEVYYRRVLRENADLYRIELHIDDGSEFSE